MVTYSLPRSKNSPKLFHKITFVLAMISTIIMVSPQIAQAAEVLYFHGTIKHDVWKRSATGQTIVSARTQGVGAGQRVHADIPGFGANSALFDVWTHLTGPTTAVAYCKWSRDYSTIVEGTVAATTCKTY